MRPTVIVVPCYNEAERFDASAFAELLDEDGVSLLLVDDGSTDRTLEILEEFARDHEGRAEVLPLSPNRGKGEAVRQGLLQALDDDPEIVAFVDADLATPIDEILRLAGRAHESDADAIIGSRIAYLGAEIDRHQGRHVLGRVFASAASLALNAPIYDTQCGAKFFRASSTLHGVLDEEFHSRWAFDVELLGRLLADGGRIVEVPLKRWVDVPGSKIGMRSMVKAGLDLLQIRSFLRARRGK